MLFMYVGTNPNGLADYYGHKFPIGVAVNVVDPLIVAKCNKNPAFEVVNFESADVSQSNDSEPTTEDHQEDGKPKKRGRPRKVTNGD